MTGYTLLAASIIGFIRQAALGDALLPYEQRVERAVNEIMASQQWTPIQKRWLNRIAKQLLNEKNDPVVDKGVINQPPFDESGGFNRINKDFDGQLDTILSDINEAIWKEVS